MIRESGQPTLLDYLRRRYLLHRAVGPGQAYQLDRSCRILADWLGCDPLLADLDADLLSAWVRDDSQRYAPRTARRHRADVLGVIRDAAAEGLCDEPRRVRPVRRPTPDPRAWTAAEVSRILAAAYRTAFVRRHPRRVPPAYWPALIRTAWETGLRRGDLLRLRQADIRDDGTVTVTQHKTGTPLVRWVEPETLRLLRGLGVAPLAWPMALPTLGRHFARIVQAARVRPLGGLHALRRSGATDVALHCHRTQAWNSARSVTLATSRPQLWRAGPVGL